jgi:hypothetical protein
LLPWLHVTSMSEHELDNPDPSSDVGSPRVAQSNFFVNRNVRIEQSRTNPGNSDNQWRVLFERQNENMQQLIKVISTSGTANNQRVVLPEFNPDKAEVDARSWCATADLCFADNPHHGGQLIVVLSKAFKGSASAWLAQVSYPGMTWLEFKDLFIARFVCTETNAGTLINFSNDKPNENETLSSYASRLISMLTTRWRDVTKEQIAVSTVLAHVSQFDSRLQRLAFTTEITSRQQLQKELQAYAFLKRKSAMDYDNKAVSENKRMKLSQSTVIKCFHCGMVGHRRSECRQKGRATNVNPHHPTASPTAAPRQPAPRSSFIVCFKCGEQGHVASACTSHPRATNNPPAERRVDLCEVRPPSGTLEHRSESFGFHYDSGAECSLIKESVAAKFSGKRIIAVVSLNGIGPNCVKSTEQVLCDVKISGYSAEILLHVLPDCYMRSDIMIGRDILGQGFSVNMTATEFSLTKVSVVNSCVLDNTPLGFDNIDTDIRLQDKPKLLETLDRFSESFTTGMPTTRVKTGELKIRLKDPNRTVQRRPYRLSADERRVMRERVDELLRANIIRPSCSPFASPALLVKKADNSDRMVIDYRELNNNTVPDRYPLPLIQDQISRLHGANYFTKLDCASGFHLIPVSPESIERTAFVTPEGTYEYLSMPFGLRNAISVFQRAIVKALGDLAHDYVIVYVDDILIVSKDVEQGLERLNTVLDVLTKAGFSLNLKKCSFLKTKVEFLGYEVEKGEVRPNNRKVEALTTLPPPESVTQLRQFIGLSSYFRQFIPNFSCFMRPLYKLTSLKGSFVWKPEHEEIRQKVITILTSNPVLMIFDPQHPTELHTDASSEGYGAVLLQIVDKKRHVVGYFSKRTSPAEAKYHSYELETLAVVNAIKHFRQYLHGLKFRVVTDCNSLKASRNKIDLTPRVHRWWAYLQSFDFDVEYREGKRMPHVDFLSRNPLPPATGLKRPVERIEQKRVDITELSTNWLLAEQQRDTEIAKILEELNNDSLDRDLANTYALRSGVLHRKIQRNGRTKCLPIVPHALKWSVINNIHESIVHLGYEKTLEKVYDYYWFEGMSRYVKKFVDNCVTCKIAKSHSGKIQAELHPIPKVTSPWHTIHIDVTGKLSGKNDSKEYAFVLIDAFTKFVLLYHTKNIETKSSIQAIINSVNIFGAPSRIIADQGRCFASREFREFCESKNIELHLIATGSSRANGQVERVMSVLKSMLTAIEASDKSWQDSLGDVQLALNCTVNRVTKYSPLELMIGKVARPLALMGSDVDVDMDLDEIRGNAAEQIEKSAQYNKRRFDSTKAKLNRFSVGDFVLIENEERNQTKLDPKFKGPFKVMEVLDGDRYTLKALNSKRTYKYAHDRLRRMPGGRVPITISDSEQSEHEQLD